jgi:glycosidase
VIYEVFTWPWLTALSAREACTVTLADVPERAWDSLALPGVDAVWLMGVWERSAAGRGVALDDPRFRAATSAALPDASEADVVGSPYCIRSYAVDARLGGREGLASARAALAERGLRLLLDFVPNHVAPDHAWVADHPEYFVRGTEEDLATAPTAWLRTAGDIYARGRDPNDPPWPDVVQLDPMSAALREAAVATLNDIAGQCDGVRCDMAMLMLDEVAQRTWSGRLQPVRDQPYWSEVTSRVRHAHPDFLFLAEAYWDLEGPLLEQGIDFCYDKTLYDRLRDGDAASVRAHLLADPRRQARSVRFLENHDEPRAASAFAPDRLRAAAIALLTLPGAVLLHEGQLDGLRTRLPVQLGRRPPEPPDLLARAFWSKVLATVASERLRHGDWHLLEVTGWPDNQSCRDLLAWRWAHHLVVINYGERPADGLVNVGRELGGQTWELHDVLHAESYRRDGDDLAVRGLYVALPPYGAHIFRLPEA